MWLGTSPITFISIGKLLYALLQFCFNLCSQTLKSLASIYRCHMCSLLCCILALLSGPPSTLLLDIYLKKTLIVTVHVRKLIIL